MLFTFKDMDLSPNNALRTSRRRYSTLLLAHIVDYSRDFQKRQATHGVCKNMEMLRIELRTSRMQSERSATELHPHGRLH